MQGILSEMKELLKSVERNAWDGEGRSLEDENQEVRKNENEDELASEEILNQILGEEA